MTINGILLDNHYSHIAGAIAASWVDSHIAEDVAAAGGRVLSLTDAGLPRNVDDRTLWRFCQHNGFILFTDNRNSSDSNSLHQTIAEEGDENSIPVVTPGDRMRLTNDALYRHDVFMSLVEVIVDIHWYGRHLGSGRVYLPLPSRTP